VRTPKTKVITLANHSKLKANTCSQRKARENVCVRATIGFGFTCDWITKRNEFLSQSLTMVMQNQSKCEFVSTLKWIPLWSSISWTVTISLITTTSPKTLVLINRSNSKTISFCVPFYSRLIELNSSKKFHPFSKIHEINNDLQTIRPGNDSCRKPF